MESFDAQGALSAVLEHVRQQLTARTARFLDRAERTLAETWPHTLDLGERALMMQASRWLASNRTQIHLALSRRLVEALAAPVAHAPDVNTLRVLQADELAVVLARDHMIAKVMTQGREELAALETRFEMLERAGARANPKAFWPGALADGFVAVLRQFGVPEKVQRLVMEVYGDEGIKLLLEFYRGINAVLEERGLDASPRPDPPFSLARSLKPVLEHLQRSMAGVSLKNWQAGLLRERIERQFGAQAVLTRAQVHSIDHVEALLLDWLRDERISLRVREEIRGLTLPVLVARLSSAEEFAAPDNPIRVFLRQLAVLGYRDQETPLATFDSLRMVVQRILAEQGGDPASFRSGADALNTLSRQEVRRSLAVHTKERIARPGGAQETFDAFAREAHRVVVAELTEHAAGVPLPAQIKQFVLRLLGPWMMVRYHRYGPDSVPWQHARAFAASFFDGLRPAVDRNDEARKRELRSRILQQSRIRIERSRAPVAEAVALLGALERHLGDLDGAAGLAPADTPAGDISENFLDALQPIPSL